MSNIQPPSTSERSFILTMKGKQAWIGNRHMLDHIHALEKADQAIEALRAAGLLGAGKMQVSGIIAGLTDEYTIWRPAMIPDRCSVLLELTGDDQTLPLQALDVLYATEARDKEFQFIFAPVADGTIFERAAS